MGKSKKLKLKRPALKAVERCSRLVNHLNFCAICGQEIELGAGYYVCDKCGAKYCYSCYGGECPTCRRSFVFKVLSKAESDEMDRLLSADK